MSAKTTTQKISHNRNST